MVNETPIVRNKAKSQYQKLLYNLFNFRIQVLSSFATFYLKFSWTCGKQLQQMDHMTHPLRPWMKIFDRNGYSASFVFKSNKTIVSFTIRMSKQNVWFLLLITSCYGGMAAIVFSTKSRQRTKKKIITCPDVWGNW